MNAHIGINAHIIVIDAKIGIYAYMVICACTGIYVYMGIYALTNRRDFKRSYIHWISYGKFDFCLKLFKYTLQ